VIGECGLCWARAEKDVPEQAQLATGETKLATYLKCTKILQLLGWRAIVGSEVSMCESDMLIESFQVAVSFSERKPLLHPREPDCLAA
jgi:hypothetical protein